MNMDEALNCHSERSEESSVMFDNGYATGFCATLRMTVLGALLLFGLMAVAAAAEPEMRLSPKKVRDEVRATVEGQLAALANGDFGAAYEFAATGIRRQFEEPVFALMIKRGFAPLLRPDKKDLGVVRDDGEGTAQIVVTVTDRQKRSTVYRYWLVQEEDVWRIAGVVLEQKPPSGDT
jgi:Domain of unknown function (DUF4864)